MRKLSRTYPAAAEANSAAAERERMRAQTRELHEAAQDARAAARELRAERTAAAAAAETDAIACAAIACAAIDTHLTEQLTEMAAQTVAITELRDSFLARLAELADTDLDQKGMETFMTEAVLRAVRTPEFISRVVDAVSEEIAASPALCSTRKGQVLVATPDALAAFRAAGGDPGYVLDMRA
jgi:hypothetical protein